jgi:hypothetical protein
VAKHLGLRILMALCIWALLVMIAAAAGLL